MLLTFIINSLNSAILLIAIQNNKKRNTCLSPHGGGVCTHPSHPVIRGVSIRISTETLALGKSHKHLKEWL